MTSSRVPSRCVSASTTFLSVWAAVHSVAPSVAGPAMPGAGASRWAFEWSTSVWIVGVFGESKMTGAPSPSNGIASGTVVVYASTFAA